MKGTINLVKDAVHYHFNDQQGLQTYFRPDQFVIGPPLASFQEDSSTFGLVQWWLQDFPDGWAR